MKVGRINNADYIEVKLHFSLNTKFLGFVIDSIALDNIRTVGMQQFWQDLRNKQGKARFSLWVNKEFLEQKVYSAVLGADAWRVSKPAALTFALQVYVCVPSLS